jgi:CBS domain-containing protein
MHTVAHILERKGPVFNCIHPDATALDAITQMKCENISYLIVQHDSKYLGIISERDYTHKIIIGNKSSCNTRVKDIMDTHVPVVGLNYTIEDCIYLVNATKERYIAVFDGSLFKGIVTIHDLMREGIPGYYADDEKSNNKNNLRNNDRSTHYAIY